MQVGNLRVKAIAAADPIIQDCVVTGHDRGFIGLLGFVNLEACRGLCPDLGEDGPPIPFWLTHVYVTRSRRVWRDTTRRSRRAVPVSAGFF